jgi:hypothetical protein
VRGEDRRAKAAIEAGSENRAGDVEARADFALGRAMGCLGEVVEAAFSFWRGEIDVFGQVVGEESGG